MWSAGKSFNFQYFTKYVYIVFAYVMSYSVLYWSLGARLCGALLFVGGISFTPLTLWLTHRYPSLGRFVFILSCLFYILAAPWGIRSSVNSEYYFIAALILPFLLFESETRGFKLLSLLASPAAWAIQNWGPKPHLSAYWIPNSFPTEIFQAINYLGASFIVFLFMSLFARELWRIAGLLEEERAKSLQASKLASLGEMSAGIAHEINNPLAIISGNVALLERTQADPEKFRAKIQAIHRATQRIAKIVNGLRKFSRNSEHAPYQLVTMKAIVEEALNLTETKSNRHAVTMSFLCESNENVFCDEIELEQVMINLITNAIDAAKESPEKWVEIRLFQTPEELVLQIRDSGKGLSPQARERIFQPFFTTKPVGQGTGLGLSIAKGILDQHRAEFSLVEDSPNTCFEIRFRQFEEQKNAA